MGEQEVVLQDEDDNTPIVDDADSTPPVIDGEVEIVIDTEEEDNTPAPKRNNPVRDMRQRIKEQGRENTGLKDQNELLRKQLEEAQANPVATPAAPAVELGAKPTLAGCGYDTDKYEAETDAWYDKKLDTKLDARFKTVDSRAQRTAATEQAESVISGHYERASSLKVGDYESTEDAAVAALGSQLVQSIQTTVGNSERLIYWLGKNPEKAAALKVQFDSNPGKATFELGVLSSKLTMRPVSKGAPNPDIPLTGGGSNQQNTSAFKKFTKRLDEAYDKGDLAACKAVREEALQSGVSLPYNRT